MTDNGVADRSLVTAGKAGAPGRSVPSDRLHARTGVVAADLDDHEPEDPVVAMDSSSPTTLARAADVGEEVNGGHCTAEAAAHGDGSAQPLTAEPARTVPTTTHDRANSPRSPTRSTSIDARPGTRSPPLRRWI